MKPYYAALALLASACSFTAGEPVSPDDIHTPLVYRAWQMNKLDTGSTKVCSLSTGYQGMTVLLGKKSTTVRSNRGMGPGVTFTVDVDGGKRFSTGDVTFSDADGKKLVEALSHGQKAYLEWTEPRPMMNRGVQRVDNIVKLEYFATQVAECRKWLGKNK